MATPSSCMAELAFDSTDLATIMHPFAMRQAHQATDDLADILVVVDVARPASSQLLRNQGARGLAPPALTRGLEVI